MELLGSRVPFLDPFTFDDDDFEEARGAEHSRPLESDNLESCCSTPEPIYPRNPTF